jgi:hypothetical protein
MHLDEGAHGVKLLLRVLLVVALTGDPDAHTVRHVLDPRLPESLVELLIYPHIRGAHGLEGELLHLGHSAGSTPLEGPARGSVGKQRIQNW